MRLPTGLEMGISTPDVPSMFGISLICIFVTLSGMPSFGYNELLLQLDLYCVTLWNWSTLSDVKNIVMQRQEQLLASAAMFQLYFQLLTTSTYVWHCILQNSFPSIWIEWCTEIWLDINHYFHKLIPVDSGESMHLACSQ